MSSARDGAGQDQGEDSGSEGTRARLLPKTSVKFFFSGHQRIQEIMQESGFCLHREPYFTPLAPSLTGQLAVSRLLVEEWRATFPWWETLPFLRREEHLNSP